MISRSALVASVATLSVLGALGCVRTVARGGNAARDPVDATIARDEPTASLAPPSEKCAILVLVDGLRWEEVYTGAERRLMNAENGGVRDVDRLEREYWRETPEERRAALMPFLWSTVAKEGQLLGDPSKGSRARVTNGLNFSYPGYSEMLQGFVDPSLDSNDKRPNPNVTVLEWLHGRPGFDGRVAAFAAWDVVPYILNRERAGFLINAGFEPLDLKLASGRTRERIELLNELKQDLAPHFEGEPDDAITFHSALAYVEAQHPRVLYLMFGETDEWGHAGRYDQYLDAARRTDRFLAKLWAAYQSHPAHRGNTTMIVAADHGRGSGPVGWKKHGKDVAGSEDIWIAVIGPDVEPLGVRGGGDEGQFVQASIASTLAAALGEDYCAEVPAAALPLARVVRGARQ